MWYRSLSFVVLPLFVLGSTILQKPTKTQSNIETNISKTAFYSTNIKSRQNLSAYNDQHTLLQLELLSNQKENNDLQTRNGTLSLLKHKHEPPFESTSRMNSNIYTEPISNHFEKKNVDSHFESTDSAVKMLKYETGDTIRLKCHIPNGPYLVMWNKIGIDYPLSIDSRRFVPDERVQIRFKAPDKWRLSISNAKLSDTGVYTCTTSARKTYNTSNWEDEHQGQFEVSNSNSDRIHPVYSDHTSSDSKSKTILNATSKERRRFINYDYYVTVVEPNPSDRFQVDAPAAERTVKPNKSIIVTGPKIVFYGTPLELICRASFPSHEAKLNPSISLEWYHRGVRRRANPTRSGGVYISERWIESNILESRLLVAWASEADAGQWICLDRSQFPSIPNILRTEKSYHYFSYSNRNRFGANSVNLAASTDVSNTNGLTESSNQIPESLTAYVADSRERDMMFDRIEVEIVDIPDPTADPSIDSFVDTMPTFVKPGTLHDHESANYLYGKRETGSVLRSTSGAQAKSFIKSGRSSTQFKIRITFPTLLITVFIIERHH